MSNQFNDMFALTEWHMYGSSRLGVHKPMSPLGGGAGGGSTGRQLVHIEFEGTWNQYTQSFTDTGNTTTTTYQMSYDYFSLTRGEKNYEMVNHLGNVLVIISDKKLKTCEGDTVNYYMADVLQATDYSAFGVILKDREYYSNSSNKYRMGFNGKERDNETYGDGNVYDYGFRIYNPRLGKFLSVDPLTKEYPWYTPYQFAGNNPIYNIDLDGLEERSYLEEFLKLVGYDSPLKQKHSSDIEEEARNQHEIQSKRDATKAVGKKIERLYGAQKTVFSILPGMGAVLSAMEGNYVVATGELAFELSGGKIVQGTVKGVAGIVTDFRRITGASANSSFLKKGYDAPYDVTKEIVEFSTTQTQKFARVYSSKKENEIGAFMLRVDDIKGLSPQEIQKRYSLDYVPDMIEDVVVPVGTQLRAGSVAARKSVAGTGGVIQYELLDRIDQSAFTNKRKLKK